MTDKKMKNVIFWDNDKSERQRALGKLNELGYIHSYNGVGCFGYGLSMNGESCPDGTIYYDNPTRYNSAAEFIKALEEFHKPEPRPMTPVEIVKAVLESELKSVVFVNSTIDAALVFDIENKEEFYFSSNQGYWTSYKNFIKKYELLVSINNDGTMVTKKFEVVE